MSFERHKIPLSDGSTEEMHITSRVRNYKSERVEIPTRWLGGVYNILLFRPKGDVWAVPLSPPFRVECYYGWHSLLLHLCSDVIFSCCGVTPWSPEFSLTLHPIVKHIKAKVPAWCLDDGTLCGSLDDLALALRFVEEDGLSLGLHLI